ncbi:MAG: hypothetical protein P8X82_03900 [Gemmatimonadales bacterium]
MTGPRIPGTARRSPLPRRLRRYFVVGLIVIAPVGLTISVLNWVFQRMDGLLGRPLEQALGFRIPGLGFILLALEVRGRWPS